MEIKTRKTIFQLTIFAKNWVIRSLQQLHKNIFVDGKNREPLKSILSGQYSVLLSRC